MVTLYMDVCCLNRPFNDRTQTRIRLEAEAVMLVLQRIEQGEWAGVGSDVQEWEIAQTPDLEKQARMQLFTRLFHSHVETTPKITQRAQELHELGFARVDALHLACAESIAADALLTTDDRFQRRATRLADHLRVRVTNPLIWIQEMTEA